MNRLLRTLAVALLAGLAACSDEAPAEAPKPPGIQANPTQLPFLCVAPGCDESRSVDFTVVGPRRAAVKRILIEGDTAKDFDFNPSEPAPFIVGSNSGFSVTVHYAPKGAPAPGAVNLVVTYTDASPDEGEGGRLEPGELKVPLVRRVVGEPRLGLSPKLISFGVVAPGESKTVNAKATNEGFGNVALEIGNAQSGVAEVAATLPPLTGMGPGASIEVPVAYNPKTPKYVHTTVTFTPTAKDVPSGTIEVEGTSLAGPRVSIEPAGNIDFGELPKGKSRTVAAKLVNQGGKPLTVSAVTVVDASGNLEAHLADDGFPRTVSPLERVPLTLTLNGTTPAELAAEVRVASDDPDSPTLAVKVYGTVTEPQLTLSPTKVDFGAVAQGWVVRKSIELRNTGYGPLTIKNITLVAGSANLFTLQSLPALPMTLKREARVGIEVEFRAETMATFVGNVSVESDDPVNPFQEVALTAKAASCTDTCIIANGAPACSNGACSIASCKANYYDVDTLASTGCECHEPGTDAGAFCADSLYMGTLKDNDGTLVTHTGIVPRADDVDVVRFYGEDASWTWGDKFDVKIRLDSADPNVQMCVYRHPGGHSNDCYWTNEVCGLRFFEKTGSGGTEDGADFYVKVFRKAGSANSCTSYTLYMSNGR